MIVLVEKPFRGPPIWARSYLGANVRTPKGYGRVTEAVVKPSDGVVVLKVYVEAKKVKAMRGTG